MSVVLDPFAPRWLRDALAQIDPVGENVEAAPLNVLFLASAVRSKLAPYADAVAFLNTKSAYTIVVHLSPGHAAVEAKTREYVKAYAPATTKPVTLLFV